ncbi:MAG TPA: GGDEF domain-containing protein [Candidatus Cybelea sp.]|nr:GGDEF domain-containing protein [Candidatus Cybelea sp.]
MVSKVSGSRSATGTPKVGGRTVERAPGVTRVAEPRAINDTATVMGIPEAELTPKVRDAIMTLMAEVQSLRQELQRAHARLADLEKLADEDTLVPLPNRRAFVRELSRLQSFSQRYTVPCSLVFFDVNGFKAINDKFGHAAGDAALLRVAQTLVDNTRESDVVARIGGDEFGVILVQTENDVARKKAETLATAIQSRPLVWQENPLPLEVAYGVYPLGGGEDAGEALAAADKAMYANKRARSGER